MTGRNMEKETSTRNVGNGRYRLEKRLSRGGFGITWLATDQENQQNVVVKELCPPEGEKREKAVQNFLREARVMASLHSVKEIVKVLNYFEEQGNAYIVMEYLRVTSLRHYLECQEEPLSFEKARDMLVPVIDGLEKMHRKHVLHRDLTPDNLMLRENGSLCIIDFGSAREITEDDRTKTILLKDGYAPPEQYEEHGKQKAWTDIYSLCAVLYEMITGAIPETALSRREKDTLYPPSMYGAEISPEQEKALLKGLALDHHERYASMRELKKALLQEKEQEQTGSEKKKNTAFRISVAAALLISASVAVAAGNIIKRDTQKIQYAGNFDRGSKEAKEFLDLVYENAVSSEVSDDGKDTIYHLPEKIVRAYGLPCNCYRFFKTSEELESFLTQENFSYTKKELGTDCTATINKYDFVKTDFHKNTEYQIEDFCTFTVEEDLNNGEILDFSMTCQRDKGVGPGEFAAKFLVFLADAKEREKEMAKDLVEGDQELMEKGKKDSTIYMYQCEEALLIFREVKKDSLTIRIIPEDNMGVFDEEAYYPY